MRKRHRICAPLCAEALAAATESTAKPAAVAAAVTAAEPAAVAGTEAMPNVAAGIKDKSKRAAPAKRPPASKPDAPTSKRCPIASRR